MGRRRRQKPVDNARHKVEESWSGLRLRSGTLANSLEGPWLPLIVMACAVGFALGRRFAPEESDREAARLARRSGA